MLSKKKKKKELSLIVERRLAQSKVNQKNIIRGFSR